MDRYASARLHIETGGSIEVALDMTPEQIIDALAEAAENEKIIRALRRQRDRAELALDRVREIAEDLGRHAPSYSVHSALVANRILAAIEGDVT